MKKNEYYWVAVFDGITWGFLGKDNEIHYGSYEMAAARFNSQAAAEAAVSCCEACEGYEIRYNN